MTETLTNDFVIGDGQTQRAETEKPIQPRKQAPTRSPAPTVRNKRASLKRAPIGRVPDDPVLSVRRMEIEIYKAIRDRAITGVHIAAIRGDTVYLEGRVATTRQKLAAVRAALGVPGVSNVRDRIVIR